jgi:hypothetical protein
MSYLKLATMEYPRYEGDIRLEYPEITEDQTGDTFPVPDTYIKVQDTTPPQFDKNTQFLAVTTPVQVDGVWQQVWVVNELPPEEIARRKKFRDEMMAKSGRPSTDLDGSAPDVIA